MKLFESLCFDVTNIRNQIIVKAYFRSKYLEFRWLVNEMRLTKVDVRFVLHASHFLVVINQLWTTLSSQGSCLELIFSQFGVGLYFIRKGFRLP